MRKLLSANFSRLWKTKLFLIVLLTAAVMSGLLLFANQFNSASDIKYMDFPFFSQFIYNPVIFAAFITLFLGTEYSDGTLRNKLSIGHSRGSVYAANLCTSIILSVTFVVAQILVCLGIGLLVFEPFRMPMEYVVTAAITACMTAITFASIFTAFAMNIQSKAVSIISMVGLSFAVMLLVSMIAGVLYAPEMVYEYTEKTANGLTYGPLVPNPGYICGTARTIAQWVNDILPQGQLYSVYSYDFDRCTRWPAMAAVVVVVSTALGYYSFSKKDIK